MDSISQVLQPYKDLIGTVASYVTIAQFFSGVFICLDIRRKGNNENISAVPFVGGLGVGLAMLRYGMLLQDDAMLRVNVAAMVLNISYCIFYYIYALDKWNDILKPISIVLPFTAALWSYVNWEDPELVEFRYGLIVTALLLSLFGSPLVKVREIIAKEDASQIPFVMTLMGTIVTFLWLLYGFVILNNFMIVQNVIGFILCFVQLVLIFAYPGKPAPKDVKKKRN